MQRDVLVDRLQSRKKEKQKKTMVQNLPAGLYAKFLGLLKNP